MSETPPEFIKRTVISSFYVTTAIELFLLGVVSRMNVSKVLVLFMGVVLFIVFLFYFLKVPDVKIMTKEAEIDREIVFAGRFIIIELESGVSLYTAMANIVQNYPIIGKYFKEIVDKIDMGTSIEDAINETIETTPSANFRKVLWQILNVLRTGADVSTSLRSVLNQIVREQTIKLKEYGKKLNPMAMFYMLIAVIIPSLGITMMIVLSSFLSLSLKLPLLLSIAMFLGFLQFMFVGVVKQSRPAIEL